jgi:hypothetical protein
VVGRHATQPACVPRRNTDAVTSEQEPNMPRGHQVADSVVAVNARVNGNTFQALGNASDITREVLQRFRRGDTPGEEVTAGILLRRHSIVGGSQESPDSTYVSRSEGMESGNDSISSRTNGMVRSNDYE